MSNRTSKMMGVGMAPLAASQIAGDVQTGVVAAGTTQATATPIYGDNVVVTTCAASAGVLLSSPAPGFGPGDDVFFSNQGANACLVYPPVGGQINNLAQNAGFSVATTKNTFLRCVGANAAGNLQFYAMAAA